MGSQLAQALTTEFSHSSSVSRRCLYYIFLYVKIEPSFDEEALFKKNPLKLIYRGNIFG